MHKPKQLIEAGYDISIDASKLRNIPLPIQKMALSDLVWCFDLPLWERDNTDDWNLTPREVIEKKPYAMGHIKCVDSADLSYPIIIIYNKRRYIVLDGVHRLVKAFLLNYKTIDVKILTEDDYWYKQALR